MAYLIPDRKDIETLPQPLKKSEEKLVEALMNALDDDWTIYVQPHVNGLNPDVIIFSPKHGIAIFEVKEWSLGMYKIVMNSKQCEDSQSDRPEKLDYHWTVVKDNGEKEVGCPYKQVERYRDAIFKYEIPDMKAKQISDQNFFSVISTFVYFSGVSREYLEGIPNLTRIEGEYRYGMGDNDLDPCRLRSVLRKRHLYREKGTSKFSRWLEDHKTTIQNTFYPPKHGETDLKYLNSEPTPKQKDLIPNDPGKNRRVVGSAGSGKTFVLVRKAINAARDGKNTLLVTFNITMANYLRDLVLRLAGYYGPHVHRHIEVAHYHRLKYGTRNVESEHDDENSTLSSYRDEPVDVLLIDEGQDFETFWVEELLGMCADKHHAMFVEDDRQNIYLRDKVSVPQFIGRPNQLNESHRIPNNLIHLANALYEYYKIENESGVVEPFIKRNSNSQMFPAIWYNAEDYEDALEVLKLDIRSLWSSGRFGQPSDSAILLCQVSQGWDIEDWIAKSLPICRNRMFESRSEARKLKEKYGIDLDNEPSDAMGIDDKSNKSHQGDGRPENQEKYKSDLNQLRRKYKVLFQMRNDGLKLSTIHSFKGWELEHIFILFAPDEKQYEAAVPLLYTALTRSQNNVTIYNASPRLTDFGEHAIRQRLVARWQPAR